MPKSKLEKSLLFLFLVFIYSTMAVGTKMLIFKRFNTWTKILLFLDEVDAEYKRYNMSYNVEIYFDEVFNEYKLILIL